MSESLDPKNYDPPATSPTFFDSSMDASGGPLPPPTAPNHNNRAALATPDASWQSHL